MTDPTARSTEQHFPPDPQIVSARELIALQRDLAEARAGVRVGPGQRNHDLSDGCVPSHGTATEVVLRNALDAQARELEALRTEKEKRDQEWLYVMSEPLARAVRAEEHLADAERELEAARAEIERLRALNERLRQQGFAEAEQLEPLRAENERLRAALAEISSLTSDMATGITAAVYVKANHALDTSADLARDKRA